MSDKQKTDKTPFFENGFWWWYHKSMNGWYIGSSPQIQKPSWAE